MSFGPFKNWIKREEADKSYGRPGGLKKIRDFPPQNACRNPGHEPPGMIVLSPGIYCHTCPGCGRVTTFAVPPTTLQCHP